MHRLEKIKIISILLSFTMILTIIFPALAGTLAVKPEKPTYSSGEEITVTASIYDGDTKVTSGIDWYYVDKDGNKHDITGDSDSVSFTVPANNSNQTVTSVVYAVYDGEEHWTNIDVDPSPQELAVASQSPEEGGTITAEDEIYLEMNQEVDEAFVNGLWISVYYDQEKDGDAEEIVAEALGSELAQLDETDHKKIKLNVNSYLEAEHVYRIDIWYEKEGPDDWQILRTMNFNVQGAKPLEDGATIKPENEIFLLMDHEVDEAYVANSVYIYLYYAENPDDEPENYIAEGFLGELDPDNRKKIILNINDYLKAGYKHKLEFWYEEGGNWSCQNIVFTVYGTAVSSVKITNAKVDYIIVGSEMQLYAEVKDVSGKVVTDVAINWKSNNPEVAAVDESGLVKAKSPGEVTITAAAGEKEDIYKIYVKKDVANYLISKWKYKIPVGDSMQYLGYPIVSSDGSVYCAMHMNEEFDDNLIYRIHAFNADGTKKETFYGREVTVPPVIANVNGEECLLTAKYNTFMALHPETGAVLWQRELDTNIISAAAIGKNGNIYVCGEDNRVYALNQEIDGYVWKYYAQGPILYRHAYIPVSLTVDDAGNVYVVAGDTLWVIDGQKGECLWKFVSPEHFDIKCQPAVSDDGTIFIYDYEVVDCYYDENDHLVKITKSNIYALTQEGVIKWTKTYEYIRAVGERPLIDLDGGVYFHLKKDSIYKYVKFNPDNGEIIEEYFYNPGNFSRLDRNGMLYTTGFIMNQDKQLVAYYDEYSNDLPYFNFSQFSIGKDGTIYRYHISEGNVVAIEAAVLQDTSDSVISELKVYEEDVTMYPNESYNIRAEVLDQYGNVMPLEGLDWESSNEDIVTVRSDGLVTSKENTGDAVVTVTVRNKPELAGQINIQVVDKPVPVKMYFVLGGHKLNNKAEAEAFKIDKITAYNDEGFSPVEVFIEDQYGNHIQHLDIEWTLEDATLADMLNYQGNSGDYEHRYNASLTGKKVGKTTLTATIKDTIGTENEISCSLEVEVLPAPYEVLWSVPLDGKWWAKFAKLALGTNGEVFYDSVNKLFAVNKDTGISLWQSDIGEYLGIEISRPQVDTDGTVYVYGKNSTSLVAVDPADGEITWYFKNGLDPVKSLKIAPDALYLLTKQGRLYKLNKDGNQIWNEPLSIGEENDGIAVSPDGKVFASLKGSIYKIGEDKEKQLVYAAGASTKLYIEDFSAEGDLIIQKEQAGQYSLILLSPQGNEIWSYDNLSGRVVLNCRDGVIYAAAMYQREVTAGYERDLYFLNVEGGTEKAATSIFSERYEASGNVNYIRVQDGPVMMAVGESSIFLVCGTPIYCLSKETGEFQWRAVIKETFTAMPPQSIVVDENDVIYITAGEMGVMAIKGKEVDLQGIQLRVTAGKKLHNDTLCNLDVQISNNEEEAKEIELRISCAAEGKIIKSTSIEDKLMAKDIKKYNCGVYIPKDGEYVIKVQVFDKNNMEKALCEKRLPVK